MSRFSCDYRRDCFIIFKSTVPSGGQPTPISRPFNLAEGAQPARCHFYSIVSSEPLFETFDHIVQDS